MYHKKSPIYPSALFDALLKITKLNSESKILEVGSANSLATLPLVTKGLNVTSVEFMTYSEPAAKKKQEIVFKNVSLDEAQLSQNSFDFIYATKPLYCLINDTYLDKVYTLLKANAKLAIIEIKPVFESKNIYFDALRKTLLKEIYNYDANKIERLTCLNTFSAKKDAFNKLANPIFYTEYLYNLEKYEAFIKTFPEFKNLPTEKQQKILTLIKESFMQAETDLLFSSKYAFELILLEKKEPQLKLYV